MEKAFKDVTIKKKRDKNSYPIYMDLELINKVKNWQKQLNEHFNGLINVTISDVCSEVLFCANPILNSKILEGIEAKKLDPIKKLKLLLNKAIEANKDSKEVSIKELIEDNSLLLGLSKNKQKPRKRKSIKSNEIIENKD